MHTPYRGTGRDRAILTAGRTSELGLEGGREGAENVTEYPLGVCYASASQSDLAVEWNPRKLF